MVFGGSTCAPLHPYGVYAYNGVRYSFFGPEARAVARKTHARDGTYNMQRYLYIGGVPTDPVNVARATAAV